MSEGQGVKTERLMFLVVENRNNSTMESCRKSAKNAGIDLRVISSVDGGDEFEAFSKNYVHMSTNRAEFELICFRRYFLLSRFLNDNSDVSRFVLIDSDVLLFQGVEEHLTILTKNESFMGSRVVGESEIAKMLSPHVSYWTANALHDFVDFLSTAYLDREILCELTKIKDYFFDRGALGGVTDMALLYLWSESRGYVGSVNARTKGKMIDHNISVSDNNITNEYKTWLGFKLIKFEKNNVYVFGRDGEKVRALALHFQGRAKLAMESCRLSKQGGYFAWALMIYLAKRVRLIKRRLIG